MSVFPSSHTQELNETHVDPSTSEVAWAICCLMFFCNQVIVEGQRGTKAGSSGSVVPGKCLEAAGPMPFVFTWLLEGFLLVCPDPRPLVLPSIVMSI